MRRASTSPIHTATQSTWMTSLSNQLSSVRSAMQVLRSNQWTSLDVRAAINSVRSRHPVSSQPANPTSSLQANSACDTRARHLQILRNLQCSISSGGRPTGRGDGSDCRQSFDNGHRLAHACSVSCCRPMLEVWWEILDGVNKFSPHSLDTVCILHSSSVVSTR
jgi:hypothetical protein